MNFLRIAEMLKTLNLSFFPLRTKCTLKILSNRILKYKSNLFSTSNFPTDNISNLKKDVLLYTNEKSKTFKYLTFFGTVQLVVWGICGVFVFQNVKDFIAVNMKSHEDFSNRTIWRQITLGEMKYRIISVVCLGIGIFTAVACCALSSRIVKELTLCKGGKVASIVTYSPFGRPLKQTVPLQNLSCLISRKQAKSYIALKIKKKWFYYLVDSRGLFHQPMLFDYSIKKKSSKAY